MKNRARFFVAMTILALLAGFLAGSYEYVISLFDLPQDSQANVGITEEPPAEDIPAENIDSDEAASESTVPYTNNFHKIDDNLIRSGAGLQLRAARRDGEFLGYRVIDSGSDERLTNGAIITAVNGIDVEDSAAGGELLIAALADGTATIDVLSNEH